MPTLRSFRPSLQPLAEQLLTGEGHELYDFLWHGRTEPGPIRLIGGTSTADFIADSGLPRTKFYEAMRELKAHGLADSHPWREPVSQVIRGTVVEVKLPPETIPPSAIDYYIGRIDAQISALNRRRDRLFHLWMKYRKSADSQ